MRYLYIIIFAALFLGGTGFAQTTDSSSAQKDKKQTEVKQQQKSIVKAKVMQQQKLADFVDANGNGIDDRVENGTLKGKNGKMKGKGPRKDRFIDLDGDGICDGKESAIGLRKLQRQRRGQSGGH